MLLKSFVVLLLVVVVDVDVDVVVVVVVNRETSGSAQRGEATSTRV